MTTKRENLIKEQIDAAWKLRWKYPNTDCVITSGNVGEGEVFGFHFEPLNKCKRGDIIKGTTRDLYTVEAVL